MIFLAYTDTRQSVWFAIRLVWIKKTSKDTLMSDTEYDKIKNIIYHKRALRMLKQKTLEVIQRWVIFVTYAKGQEHSSQSNAYTVMVMENGTVQHKVISDIISVNAYFMTGDSVQYAANHVIMIHLKTTNR